MYVERVNTKKYPKAPEESLLLKDEAAAPHGASLVEKEEQMVRTQIYLTRREHQFLRNEASKRGEAMSSVLRQIIDEKMTIPEDAWTNNPLLEPTPEDPDFDGHEDSAINHDHYVYGCPKKYEKRNGKWVLLPPLDE